MCVACDLCSLNFFHLPQLEIVLVNDAPILSFLSGGSEEEYYYTEDDPPINIGANLTLSDIDSDIQSVSLYLPGKAVHLSSQTRVAPSMCTSISVVPQLVPVRR